MKKRNRSVVKAARERAHPGEQFRQQGRAHRRVRAGVPTSEMLNLAPKGLERRQGHFEKSETFHQPRDCIGKLCSPRGSRGGYGRAQANHDRENGNNQYQGGKYPRRVEPLKEAVRGLEEKGQDESQHERPDDFSRDVKHAEECDAEKAAQVECLRIGGERHRLFARLSAGQCGPILLMWQHYARPTL